MSWCNCDAPARIPRGGNCGIRGIDHRTTVDHQSTSGNQLRCGTFEATPLLFYIDLPTPSSFSTTQDGEAGSKVRTDPRRTAHDVNIEPDSPKWGLLIQHPCPTISLRSTKSGAHLLRCSVRLSSLVLDVEATMTITCNARRNHSDEVSWTV